MTPEELVAGKIREGAEFLDAVVAVQIRYIEDAARGLEHVPRAQQILNEWHERWAAWREQKLAILESELRAAAGRLN
jgi:hypothetical protein